MDYLTFLVTCTTLLSIFCLIPSLKIRFIYVIFAFVVHNCQCSHCTLFVPACRINVEENYAPTIMNCYSLSFVDGRRVFKVLHTHIMCMYIDEYIIVSVHILT